MFKKLRLQLHNYSKSDIASIVLVSVIWGERLLYYVRSVLLRIPVIREVALPFIGVAIVVTILLTFKYVKWRFRAVDFLVFFGAVIIYILHMAVYPYNTNYLLDLLTSFCFVVLPYYLLGIVCDTDKNIRVLEYVSFAYVVLGVIYYYYAITAGFIEQDEQMDAMGMAYQFLPHTILLLYGTLRHFSILSLSGTILGIVMILGSGNRGSLLMLIVFSLLYLSVFEYKITNKFSFWRVLLIILSLAIIIFINPLVDTLTSFIGDLGMSTRSLEAFVNGEFADDNGRKGIAELITSKIAEGPLLGYGLCGDRVIVGGSGGYAHNLFYELLISFGPVIGSFFIVWVLFVIIRGFFKCTSVDQRAFLALLLCCGFVKLFISNSFLEERYFFFLMGYCVSLNRFNKKTEQLPNLETLQPINP